MAHGILLTVLPGFVGSRMAIPDAALVTLVNVASIVGGMIVHRLVERPVVGWARRVVGPGAGDTPDGS